MFFGIPWAKPWKIAASIHKYTNREGMTLPVLYLSMYFKFSFVVPIELSLRTSPQAGVAIPQGFWRRFPSNRGIPTPVCALARNDMNILGGTSNSSINPNLYSKAALPFGSAALYYR